ncbi:MAG: hypothetical protein GX142_04010 [Chloroflexi bacterium]|nr:hypothetical protein [Chloroflexota bacterium]
MTDWQTLTQQLKALGVELGKNRVPEAPRRAKYPIESVVEGQFLDLGTDQIFYREAHYPKDHIHGTRQIWPAGPIQKLCQWANAGPFSPADLKDIVFLDTETSGLAGGTGTYAFQIGAARFKDDGFHLAQFFMRHPGEEPALLMGLSNFIAGMQAVVTYNGKTFDLPLLNTRFTLMGLPNPFAGVDHFDLLPLARRLWRIRLESRTLGAVENHILGVKRGVEEVPGYLIPEIYFEYLRSQDARPLSEIFYHNAVDILSLAGLFTHMACLLHEPHSKEVQHAEDIVSLGRFFEATGDFSQAKALYKKALAKDLPMELLRDTRSRLSFILKRTGNWEAALNLWQQAAQDQELFAFEELAKYYEHHAKDPDTAYFWASKGKKALDLCGRPINECQSWHASLDHRLKRLLRKIS